MKLCTWKSLLWGKYQLLYIIIDDDDDNSVRWQAFPALWLAQWLQLTQVDPNLAWFHRHGNTVSKYTILCELVKRKGSRAKQMNKKIIKNQYQKDISLVTQSHTQRERSTANIPVSSFVSTPQDPDGRFGYHSYIYSSFAPNGFLSFYVTIEAK